MASTHHYLLKNDLPGWFNSIHIVAITSIWPTETEATAQFGRYTAEETAS